ncbi:hypothetical protein HDU87_003033 [Geranomyces variabilis]|uniref:Uncharacterized protein n=1 Tax=Geranomyces variabilis TaxID=109894 RepID=A0AAD5XN33_9FUNG|nr:hypothetical protein HDU87_003033 [Geranomyces variabilis]
MRSMLLELSRMTRATQDLGQSVQALAAGNQVQEGLSAILEQIQGLRNDFVGELPEDPNAPLHTGQRAEEMSPPPRAAQTPVARTPVRRYLDDDNVSVHSWSGSSASSVDHKNLPKFGGERTDEYEQWAKKLRIIKSLKEYSDHAIKKAIPLLFKEGKPAYHWFETLDLEEVADLDFEGWMELICEEFAGPDEVSKAMALYADCTPRSGKFKTFVEFIDEKLALRSRAFGANAAHDMPVQTTIQSILTHLPPEVRSLAQITNFKSFSELCKWAKMYFSSSCSQELDPCVLRKRHHDHAGDKEKGKTH